jgi:predicted DNA helicase
VIDEAAQSTEASVWQAIGRAERLVLAGDHCQLPATVLSDQAAAEGMRRSLMQRLFEREGTAIFRRLTVQYRMHEAIMRFSSDQFYEGSLIADASVRAHRLCDLEGVDTTPLTDCPLHLIDTAGAEYDEQIEPDGESKLNPREAELVIKLTCQLIDSGVDPNEIAIIAPYAAQARFLRDRLDIDGLEIDTVDGFQGREKEVVIVTLVRSNSQGEIGFLSDTRRTNVALTRARRKLIVIGDSATLGGHPFYAAMFDYFEKSAAYHSVFAFD